MRRARKGELWKDLSTGSAITQNALPVDRPWTRIGNFIMSAKARLRWITGWRDPYWAVATYPHHSWSHSWGHHSSHHLPLSVSFRYPGVVIIIIMTFTSKDHVQCRKPEGMRMRFYHATRKWNSHKSEKQGMLFVDPLDARIALVTIKSNT